MPPATTSRIQPHAPVAERVLLPGDPGRALRMAQWLLEAPKMLNHHRGLWGYTGEASADGALLTIQSSGTGGPSAALVVADLAALGARRVVRVGTALSAALPLGEIVVAERILASDGTSRALGGGEPDPRLTEALAGAGARRVTLLSVDVLGPEGEDALVIDLQTAAVIAAASRAHIAAASIVAVTECEGVRIGAEALAEAEQGLGRIALGALAS